MIEAPTVYRVERSLCPETATPYFDGRYGDEQYWGKLDGGTMSLNPDEQSRSIVIGGLLRILEGQGGVPKGSRAMELGCGQGVLSVMLARLGYQVDAVDGSEQGIDDVYRLAYTHRKEIAANGGHLVCRCADARALSWASAQGGDRRYDLMVSLGMFHYIPLNSAASLVAAMQERTEVGGLHAMTTWIDGPPNVPCHQEVETYPDPDGERLSTMYRPGRGWQPLVHWFEWHKPDVSHPEGASQPHTHSYWKLIARKERELPPRLTTTWAPKTHALTLPADYARG